MTATEINRLSGILLRARILAARARMENTFMCHPANRWTRIDFHNQRQLIQSGVRLRSWRERHGSHLFKLGNVHHA